MGAGYHGGFGNTKGSKSHTGINSGVSGGIGKCTYLKHIAFGSTDYMKPTDNFSKFIKRRKDIDTNGFYDIIAHGNAVSIEIQHNGQAVTINHRVAARLLKQDKHYKGQSIRLLSCSTGKLDNGFAQNLANKLNIRVQAPTDILWVKSSGKYYVTAGKTVNGKLVEDFNTPGEFKIFIPKRRKKK